MASRHPVPATVAALYAVVQAATAADATVRVDFGDPGPFAERDAIAVGLGTQDVDGVTGQVDAGFGQDRYSYDVLCTAKSWTGETGSAALVERMARAFELLDLVRAELPALVNDLADVWSARIVRETYAPLADRDEVGALVEFAVRFDAVRRL